MADVKISQLPAATTPLAGTEEVPLVQSGVTKKATVNEIVAVAGAVTGVTATSPLASSGGSTPNISLSGVVDVAHGGTNATTASGARTNLSAAASGANSDITSMSGITGAIGTADYVAFDTAYSTTLAAGQLGWNGNDTLGLGMAGGNVVQHIGEDSFYYIKASSTITKGQVVMFTGAVGASGVPTGAPATGVTDGSYIMGVAAESIANNAFGLVQFQGTLRNVNTSGFADGDILWYDPAVTGGLTKTKPSAPNVKVQVAATINGGSAGGGTILVRVSAGSVLGGTDSNVQFSTLANGNIIQYDSALGYWKNVAPSSLAVTTFSGGTTGLTPATATAGAVTLGGTLAIANGGTGQTTANAAFNALAPSQTGNAGKYLTTDGTNTSWANNPLGTVTSVDVSGGTTGLTTSGGPITSSGTITLAGTLATTNGGTGLTSFTANGVVYASSTSALTTGSALTFDGTTLTATGNAVISSNSASDALRITQTGAGNALVVEDSANPDSTPFIVNSAGQVLIGTSSLLPGATAGSLSIVSEGSSAPNGNVNGRRYSTDTSGLTWGNGKARGTFASPTIVQSGDSLGTYQWQGYDGSAFLTAAGIAVEVDGTPGTNDMPGRLIFSTTADGASGATERMRIDNAGRVSIGGTPNSFGTFFVDRQQTGQTTNDSINISATVASDVTSTARGVQSRVVPSAAAFTLSNLIQFYANPTTFGAGATVTNQYGFHAESSLTAATNNYGFYGNIASGTGRYNFYAAGTADNYFAGNTGIGTSSPGAKLDVSGNAIISDNSSNAALRITQTGAGNALVVEDSANPDSTPFVVTTDGRALIGGTSATAPSPGMTPWLQLQGTTSATSSISGMRFSNDAAQPYYVFAKSRSTTKGTFGTIVQSSDALGTILFNGDDGSSIPIQAASIEAAVDGTPGTNDMPGRLVFSTTADGASSPTERMRIDNAGKVGIGSTSIAAWGLRVGTNISGATFAYGVGSTGTVQSDVTDHAYYFRTSAATQAAGFTLTALSHYTAVQNTIGAGSTVTNQYGFNADSSLTGATNNYGFYSNIASGTGRWNFYANGTAANYFAGDMQFDKTVTAAGTTGAQTINKNAGTVNFAAAATSLVVTDSRVTTSSIIIATVGTNDITMKSVSVVAGSGSFTLYANAAATAETRVNFLIIN